MAASDKNDNIIRVKIAYMRAGDGGISDQQIAGKLGCTDRNVRYYRAELGVVPTRTPATDAPIGYGIMYTYKPTSDDIHFARLVLQHAESGVGKHFKAGKQQRGGEAESA